MARTGECLDRFGNWLWDFVSEWTLASVLGVLGFGLALYVLLRQRSAIVLEMHEGRQLANGVWQPWGATFALVNVGTVPAAVSSIGVRQRGHKNHMQLPTGAVSIPLPDGTTQTVENPEFPLRLATSQVLKWTVPLSWFRPGFRKNADIIVRVYAPRAFWRRRKKKIRILVVGSITEDTFEPKRVRDVDGGDPQDEQ